MRLTDEQINAIRENCLFDEGIRKDLLDTIEAQQQEMQQLMTLAEKMNVVDLVKENLRIANKSRHTEIDRDIKQQEIQQLQAQNAQMREALVKIYQHTSCDTIQNGYNAGLVMAMARKALTVPIDYHNPADIEAQKNMDELETFERLVNVDKLRNALNLANIAIKRHLKAADCDCIRDAMEALAEVVEK